MIFVTVGAQMPFERLVHTVDEWAARHGRNDVFAQIGPTPWRPRHIGWVGFMPPEEFRRHVAEATLLVAHAGMGSIITALELGKPILVMPRQGNLKETRNDHQVATAQRFLAQGRIAVAFDEAELVMQLDRLEELVVQKRDTLSTTASPELIQALRSFIGQAT